MAELARVGWWGGGEVWGMEAKEGVDTVLATKATKVQVARVGQLCCSWPGPRGNFCSAWNVGQCRFGHFYCVDANAIIVDFM